MNSPPPHEYTDSLADDEPDFDLPHRDAIREDNWAEFEAKGFGVAIGWTLTDLAAAEHWFGIEHVYTGDAFDWDEKRPLHHKPGLTIYVDPEGLAIGAQKWKQWLKDHPSSHDDEGGPSKT